MKLSDATVMEVTESHFAIDYMPILETGEAPRWRFNYSNYQQDPTPDILLLGAYRHPNTGNNLVGGINLHYLNPKQLNILTQVLPKIMTAGNLYSRYHLGKRLLPDVFDNYYRTYNAAYMRGVDQTTLYPKIGMIKTAATWLKKKIGNVFKTKAQRQQELEPQYPADLKSMRDRLDQAVIQLQRQPPPEEPPDSPEMQAARTAFLKYQQRRHMSTRDIERAEDEPIQRSIRDYEQQQAQVPVPPTVPQPTIPQVPQAETPEQQAIDFEQERARNRQELENPNNDINLGESIIYYSPVRKRYITEALEPCVFGYHNAR